MIKWHKDKSNRETKNADTASFKPGDTQILATMSDNTIPNIEAGIAVHT
ncbi:MAG: hypothetical protein HRT83_00685 [Hyphomicrobiaceae bacterium]|nr:hypothetical protein [Hyphomicrobiaceae bacterium]